MALTIVQFSEKDSVRVWELIERESWSGQYLGDDAFAFTEAQLEKIRAEGIPFTAEHAAPVQK